jgi:uncharacterized protein (TIGR02996 family)
MRFIDEELTLIEAIHADPASDAPRLAYADWLDLHGGSGAARMIVSQLGGEAESEWLRDYGRSWASPALSGRPCMSGGQAEQPIGGGLNLFLGDPGT